MDEKLITIKKDDLRELMFDYTKYDRDNQSKFWGIVQDTQKVHTRLLDEHTGTISTINTDIALMKQSQIRQEDILGKILEQATKTNGRVTAHDIELEGSKNYVSGWIKGLSILLMITAGLIVTVFELRLSAVAKMETDTQGMLSLIHI